MCARVCVCVCVSFVTWQILNKYVGASEENIRNLFAEADEEYKQKVRGALAVKHVTRYSMGVCSTSSMGRPLCSVLALGLQCACLCLCSLCV